MVTTLLLPPPGVEDARDQVPGLLAADAFSRVLVDCAVCGLTHLQGSGDDPGCVAPGCLLEP